MNSTSGGTPDILPDFTHSNGHSVSFVLNWTSVIDNNSLSNNSESGDIGDKSYNWIILLMCPLVVFGLAGNLLVIMAISLEKRLQNVTNYFLLSLAVADFLVSLVVMPFSIINEFTGKWLFGLVLCDIFATADVLMCTSSILHLCTISLERYIGIRYPLWTKNKTKSVVLMKIVLVWTISIAISSPITVLGLLEPHNVLIGNICALNNPHFIIYGSIFAFFIPLFIMLVMYGLTVKMLNKQAKLCNSKSGAPMMRRSTSTGKNNNHKNGNENVKYQTISLLRTSSKVSNNSLKNSGSSGPSHQSSRESHIDQQDDLEKQEQFSTRGNKTLRNLVKKHQGAIKAANVLLQKKDSVKKDNSVKTEQKATKVLGVVFLIFITCWAPFFIANIMTVLCQSCELDTTMITVFVWLGYVSSTLNPIIYTIFNRVFRMTFLKLLKCQYHTLNKSKSAMNYQRNGLLSCSAMCTSGNSASLEESGC